MKNKGRYRMHAAIRSHTSGSVLLLALILATILLSVGMGVSGIAMKEIKLSSIGNESGAAFYAADTGAECALMWDIQRPYSLAVGTFATSTDSTNLHLIPSTWDASSPAPYNTNYYTVNTGAPPPINCAVSNWDIATYGDPDRPTGDTSARPWKIQFSSDATFSYATTTFLLPLDPWNFMWSDKSQPCVIVAVGKKTNLTTNVTYTTIESHGRSSCDANPRRVERGLQISY